MLIVALAAPAWSAPAWADPDATPAEPTDGSGTDPGGAGGEDVPFRECLEGPPARWIARDSFSGTCARPADCPCPSVRGWRSSRAFAGPDPLPPVLSPYCQFEWAGAGAVDAAALNALAGGLGETASDLTPDCVITAPHAHPVTDTVRPWLRDQFRAAARGEGLLPAGGTPPSGVEIASLDSSPASPGGAIPLGNLEHGHVTGWLARDLTCDGATCFGFVSSWLALPHVDAYTTDTTHGGSFGTRVQLAQQIAASVATWKARAATLPRLVMPLALGWDPALGSPTDAASMAVHDAIVHAVCHGAFVAAAAGNDTGGPVPATGTILPAAWESELGPTAAACAAHEGVPTLSALLPSYSYPILPASSTSSSPLLISVAGVDYADEPIALTRPHSVSRFAALAFQSAAGDPAGALPPAHTGTSIGVTVAGAAAASVWAYDPSLTAPDVLALIAATAPPIATFSPSQCAGGQCLDVRRISVPAARAAVCEGAAAASNPRCPATPEPSVPPPALPSNPAFRPLDHEALRAYFGGEPVTTPTIAPSSPFELVTSVSTPAWLHPQPLQPGCTVCTLSMSTGSLDVEISAMYPSTIHNVTVSIGGMHYGVAGTMAPGQRLRAGIGATPYSRATLSWIVSSTGAAATEQITVF